MARDRSVEAYLADARSWELDRIRGLTRTVRLAGWAAVGGWVTALSAVVALAFLVPLKTVVPYLVRVDNTTGIVDVVPRYEGGAAVSELVTRYLLTHYTSVCERFNFATAEADYAECGAFNSSARNQIWYARWNPANPDSPLNRYKDGTTVRVQVISVSFFKRGNGLSDLAQVRYLKAERLGEGVERFTHWIASVQYLYVEPSQDPRVRSNNPLGFRIVEFKSEPEVSEPPNASPTPGHPGAGAPS